MDINVDILEFLEIHVHMYAMDSRTRASFAFKLKWFN